MMMCLYRVEYLFRFVFKTVNNMISKMVFSSTLEKKQLPVRLFTHFILTLHDKFTSFMILTSRTLTHIISKPEEQAGFRHVKSCTNQLFNLTQHIEDGYQEEKIMGTAFVDLPAAYDTVTQ